MFCSATLRAIIFEEKEKKTEKKRKKNALIFGSEGMKTRFLTKKYYLSFDLLRKRGSIWFLDKILMRKVWRGGDYFDKTRRA